MWQAAVAARGSSAAIVPEAVQGEPIAVRAKEAGPLLRQVRFSGHVVASSGTVTRTRPVRRSSIRPRLRLRSFPAS